MEFGNSTLIEPLAEKYDPGFTVSTTIQSGSQHSQPQGQNRYFLTPVSVFQGTK